MDKARSTRVLWVAWAGTGTILLGLAWALNWTSSAFDYNRDLRDQPAILLAVGLMVAGLIYCSLVPLLRASDTAEIGRDHRLILLIAAFGVLFRLVLFPSTPAIEDDWYRYLWDGAVTAHGYNPYALSPDDAQGDAQADALQPLAQSSGVIIERINHSDLKTIYPPVAQAAFAIAHWIEPWSLRAWRAVCLAAELASFCLLLGILKSVGRSPAWVALYWWNPVAVKELFNSAHMEAVLMPFLLAAVVLALRKSFMPSALHLGIAAGIKLWPVFLAPILLRPLLSDRRLLAVCVGILAVLGACWAVPPVLGGIDKTSGFVAYAQYWHTNSAHYKVLESIVRALIAPLTTVPGDIALVTKGLLAVVLGAVVLWLARLPLLGADDFIKRVYLAVLALLLLSPAQFPWYLIWLLPFFAARPQLGPLVATVLMPIYYVSFHYLAQDDYKTFPNLIVWGIWLPVWAAFFLDWKRGFEPLDQPARDTYA